MLRNNYRKICVAVSVWMALASTFVVLFDPLTAFAQGGIVEARVTSVRGVATISGNGRNGAAGLRVNSVLVPGDEIDTTRGGRVVIDLSDGSQVVVLPGSHILVADYRSAATLRELLQITLGRIRVRINHFKGKPNPYRIKSPTASIAVRGTEFEVFVEALGETRVVVINGVVEVASLRDPRRSISAEPGRGVIVRSDFTLDSFVSSLFTKGADEHDKQKDKNTDNVPDDNKNGGSRGAANIYERAIENIIESGETALPSRFTAFPDAFLDSLDNPAYAAAFTNAEGRIYFVPSLNGVGNSTGETRNRLGLSKTRPVDYNFIPEGSVFFPVQKIRSVIGGSFGYARNGSQSLLVDENSLLSSPPFPVGTIGVRTGIGATTNNTFNASLIYARKFGGRDQASLGFKVERLFSGGNLNETITQRDATGLSRIETAASWSAVNRTRVTLGAKYDLGWARFGAFYRYTTSSGSSVDRFRLINGVPQLNEFIRSKGNASEIGFRLRGAFSSRLYYGAEGTFLFAHIRENLQRSVIVDSNERAATTRGAIGFGLGYVFRPKTVFSFDAASGIIRGNQNRFENLTQNVLETERLRARFLSLHAAVQTDVWRNFFVSASILSLTQSRTTDLALFPDRFGRILNSDGIFVANGRSKIVFTDLYSNYGLGWRSRPNLVVQYLFTTDYGQTSTRHTFLLRYTFDLKKK